MTEKEIEAIKKIAEVSEKRFKNIEVWKQNALRAESLLNCIESNEIEIYSAQLRFKSIVEDEIKEQDYIHLPRETFIKALKHCIAVSKLYIEKEEAEIDNYKPITLNFELEENKSEEKQDEYKCSSWINKAWKKIRYLGYWNERLEEPCGE